MDIIYFNFSETVNGFSLKTITKKLLKYGLDEQTVREEYSFCKFTGDTKLGIVADMPKGHATIQIDLNSLEKWPDRNLMKFNKKCTSIYCIPIIWKLII
ncbi:hypothetical protein TURU_106440 [Turdus rufiventris]|nr:hypothetical protein TURU_106440 [Turdus rufiventris]